MKMMLRALILLPALLSALLLAGCAAPNSGGLAPETVGDRAVASDLQQRLRNDPVTRDYVLGVAVRDGTATLTGLVPDQSARVRALGIARGTPGVEDVLDRMKR